MSAQIILSEYKPGEAGALVRLFYQTVHTVCLGDYTQEQVDAWADGKADPAQWDKSFLQHQTLVARIGGELAGFADLDGDYLDRLYVHRDYQRQGVGTALAQALEQRAGEKGCPRISAHVSITARPFFEQRGYKLVREQQVERGGVFLTNFIMEKTLNAPKDH